MTVRLHGAASDELRDDLMGAVEDLRALTGHEIVVEGDGIKRVGTIDVYISPYEEIADRMPTAGGCLQHAQPGRSRLSVFCTYRYQRRLHRLSTPRVDARHGFR